MYLNVFVYMSHLLDGRDQDVWAMGEQGCSAGTKSGLYFREKRPVASTFAFASDTIPDPKQGSMVYKWHPERESFWHFSSPNDGDDEEEGVESILAGGGKEVIFNKRVANCKEPFSLKVLQSSSSQQSFRRIAFTSLHDSSCRKSTAILWSPWWANSSRRIIHNCAVKHEVWHFAGNNRLIAFYIGKEVYGVYWVANF